MPRAPMPKSTRESNLFCGHFFANPLAMLVRQGMQRRLHVMSAGLSTGCVDSRDRPAGNRCNTDRVDDAETDVFVKKNRR
jgi:hypothetical protein